MSQLEEKITSKMTWGLQEIARQTNLSVPFLRAEVRRGNLPTLKIGRRVLVACDVLLTYLSKGKDGSRENCLKEVGKFEA